ncbi:MAG TPA: hypothetical protein VFN97_20045 [Actinospica sp.]|nr:hypothetical protein [Actinospica sp.]
MISRFYTGDGWGTREQAIPGEWAMLLLLIVLGALLGLIVLWFTLLGHERSVRRRGRRPEPRSAPPGGEIALLDLGPAAAQAPEPEPETAAAEPETEPENEPAAERPGAQEAPEQPAATGTAAQRKLTDEILSRVEQELADRSAPRWKELAALVHREFGVAVHPSSIQKAVKRRRTARAAARTT